MALTITKLKMWKDPGYTQGCTEVPPAGSKKLPTPDYTLDTGQTLRPRKNSTLTALELPLNFSAVFEMSYLYLEASDGAGNLALFGWIESIEQTASSEAAVLIRWNVDWWRSYSADVTWGIGRITRCSDASLRRPPDFTPRYNKFSLYAEIDDDKHEDWIIVSYQDTESSGDTISKILIWAAGKRCLAGSPPVTVGNTPTLKDCYNGTLDEKLGLDPAAISGIWVSPVCPCDSVTVGTDAGGSYYNMSQATAGAPITKSGYGVPWISQDKIRTHTAYISEITQAADDLTTYGVTDQYGSLVGTFPWQSVGNTSPGGILVKVDVGSASASLLIYQDSPNKFYTQTRFAGAAGCLIRLPLPVIPVNSNAWSSYVYSGQREYEMETAKINQDQRFVGNLLGVGQSAATGAVGGGVAAGGTGALIGSAANTGLSLATSFIQNDIDTTFRDRLQDVTDKMHINQSSNLLIPGDGMTWVNVSHKPCIVKIEPDAVSKAQYEDMVTYNGYPVERFGNVSSFIAAGGALQISDLNLTGDVPPAGKRAIKMMLENGVRIIENNPSGVVP